jgi:8-oxo-dGTP pyrophosphatase MutT (NUDIX family)
MNALREHLLGVLHPVPESEATVLPEVLDGAEADLIPADLQPAAVLIPLIQRPTGWQVLLTKRTGHLKHHAGQISFPGGRVEDTDASPAAAALRETHEEVGIESGRVELVGSLDRFPTISGYRVTPLVGLVKAGFELKLGTQEVEEAFEVPLDFLLDSGNHQQRSAIFKGQERQFYVIEYDDYLIWGATAAMVVNFWSRYHNA